MQLTAHKYFSNITLQKQVMRKQYYHLLKKFYISSIVQLQISDLIKQAPNRFQKLVTTSYYKMIYLRFCWVTSSWICGKIRKKFCSVLCNFFIVATDNAGLMKKTSTEQDVKQIKTRTEWIVRAHKDASCTTESHRHERMLWIVGRTSSMIGMAKEPCSSK